MRYFLFLLLACLTAFAASLGDPAYSQRHTGYCDDAKSTAETLDCVNRHKKAAQEALNKAYTDLVAPRPDGEKEPVESAAVKKDDDPPLLGQAQQNWIAYRDAQCQWEASLAENPSLERVYELSCLSEMTQARAGLLQSIKGQEETETPREFGTNPRWMNVLAEDNPDVFWLYGGGVSGDLDCDGVDEHAVAGISLSAIQIAEELQASGKLHSAEAVIAVAENPVNGKPGVSLMTIPILEAQNDTGSHLCNVQMTLAYLQQNDGQEKDKPESGALPTPVKKPPLCQSVLQISDKICGPLALRWDGQNYVFDGAEEIKNNH